MQYNVLPNNNVLWCIIDLDIMLKITNQNENSSLKINHPNDNKFNLRTRMCEIQPDTSWQFPVRPKAGLAR